jgi:penicillin-binding protein 1C
VGFSKRFTVGVWVGNDSGAPMWDVSGVSGAAPIWRAVLESAESSRLGSGGGSGVAGAAVPLPAGVVRSHVRFEPAVEAERDEWFVSGTEQTVVRLAASETVAHSLIRVPADHTIIALDPDIPPAAQHLRFQTASRHPERLAWRLDGKRLGRALPTDWPLWPGTHALELVDASGLVLDRVQFEVRGASLKSDVKNARPHASRGVASSASPAGAL